jgi:hypothetical protein
MTANVTVERLARLLDGAPEKFGNRLPEAEKKALAELTELLKKLEVKNGRILSNAANLKTVSGMGKRLEKTVLSKQYLRDLAEFVSAFGAVAKASDDYFGGVSESFRPLPYYAALKRAAMDGAIEALTGAGVRASVVAPLKNMLVTAVTSGQSYAALADSLRDSIAGTDGRQGLLSRYASTYAVTALSQFHGQYMAAVNASLGFKWFRYLGSNIKTTREFCLCMTAKEYVHESEFATVIGGDVDGRQLRLNAATGLPQGMIEGTDETNFEVYRGGWNCRHSLYPTPDYLVPKEIRDRLAAKNGTAKPEAVTDSQSEYLKLDAEKWRHDYFNRNNGGYLAVDKGRAAHSEVSKNERAKFEKEYAMAMVFAQNGYRIKMLKEMPRVSSPDVTINGIPADLKKLSGHNNIVRHAKEAVRKQGAKIVLFEFDAMTDAMHKQLNILKEMGIKVRYFVSDNKNTVFEL